MLKFTFYFTDTIHELLHLDEVLYSERARTYLQLLCASFSLTELLSKTVVRNFDVMLGQALNHFEYNSVILCSIVL
jgi:hypothetical protein